MKSNIKVKFNQNALKEKISNNNLEFLCPNCNQNIKTLLNQPILICPYCNTQITLNGTNDLINNIANDITKAFK